MARIEIRCSAQSVDKLPLRQRRRSGRIVAILLVREKAGSTAMGSGIAIPHSRYPVVLPVGRPLLTFATWIEPVPFGAGALGQVDTLFVLVTPTMAVHLQMLARLAAFVQDEVVKRKLKQRSGLEELMAEARRVEQSPRPGLDRARAG